MKRFTLNSQMKTTRQIDDQKITNELFTNEDGDVVMEEVTCETGKFPVLFSLFPEKEIDDE